MKVRVTLMTENNVPTDDFIKKCLDKGIMPEAAAKTEWDIVVACLNQSALSMAGSNNDHISIESVELVMEDQNGEV